MQTYDIVVMNTKQHNFCV